MWKFLVVFLLLGSAITLFLYGAFPGAIFLAKSNLQVNLCLFKKFFSDIGYLKSLSDRVYHSFFTPFGPVTVFWKKFICLSRVVFAGSENDMVLWL